MRKRWSESIQFGLAVVLGWLLFAVFIKVVTR